VVLACFSWRLALICRLVADSLSLPPKQVGPVQGSGTFAAWPDRPGYASEFRPFFFSKRQNYDGLVESILSADLLEAGIFPYPIPPNLASLTGQGDYPAQNDQRRTLLFSDPVKTLKLVGIGSPVLF